MQEKFKAGDIVYHKLTQMKGALVEEVDKGRWKVKREDDLEVVCSEYWLRTEDEFRQRK